MTVVVPLILGQVRLCGRLAHDPFPGPARGDSLFICRRCVGVSSGTSWRGRNLHSAPSAALSSWWSSTQPSATLSVTQTSSWTPPVYCWSPSPVSPNSLSVYRTNIWVSLKLYDNQISWNMQDLHLNNWLQWCLPGTLSHPYYVLTVKDSHYVIRYWRYLGVTRSDFPVVVCLLQFSPSRWASCCSHSRFQPGETFCFVFIVNRQTELCATCGEFPDPWQQYRKKVCMKPKQNNVTAFKVIISCR